MPKPETTLDVLNWNQARHIVIKHAPKLADIIDELSPSNDHLFLKVQYPYGSEIKRFNALQLPDDHGRLHTIDHPAIQALFQKTLHLKPGYVPLGLVTKNPLEFFIHVNDRIIPWRMLYPGDWFGILSLLNESSRGLLETFP